MSHHASESLVRNLTGWLDTGGTGLHHAGDIMSPDRTIMVEVKCDASAADTGNICLEMGDVAHGWTIGRDGSLSPTTTTIGDGDSVEFVTTGVRKTSYLARLYGWVSVYVHFAGDDLTQGVVYSSDAATKWATRKRFETIWASAPQGATRDRGSMYTTGVLRRLDDFPDMLRFDSPDGIVPIIEAVSASHTPMSTLDWRATRIEESSVPRKAYNRVLSKRINLSSVLVRKEPKCGLDPYRDLVGH